VAARPTSANASRNGGAIFTGSGRCSARASVNCRRACSSSASASSHFFSSVAAIRRFSVSTALYCRSARLAAKSTGIYSKSSQGTTTETESGSQQNGSLLSVTWDSESTLTSTENEDGDSIEGTYDLESSDLRSS